MVKPRIKVINRHGFLAYQVVKIGPINPFANSIKWFEGKRYVANNGGSVFFSPGTQPNFKQALKEQCRQFKSPKIYITTMREAIKLINNLP